MKIILTQNYRKSSALRKKYDEVTRKSVRTVLRESVVSYKKPLLPVGEKDWEAGQFDKWK